MFKGSTSVKAMMASRLAAYRRDESGSIIAFSLFIFLVMLMVGGLAVDLMRFEAERKHLQHTLDSAVLAASDLKQTVGSQEVVASFLEASGFDPDAATVTVQNETLNNGDLVGRTVGAVSNLTMDTLLLGLSGVDELSTNAGGAANERIQNVEISLVLDISGSMRWGLNNQPSDPNRIDELRDAVEDFIDIVLQVECNPSGTVCTQSPNTESTTINIIPYAGHVNPGPELFEILGGNRWHLWSSCVEVTDDDFDHSRLPDGSDYQLPHFMKWKIESSVMDWGWCPKDDAGIMVAENDAETLKDFVRNIRLHDGTATHVGMKYGLALLDPSSRSVFQELRTLGLVENQYANRPAEYNDEVVKYIILMTDGQTTDQFRPRDWDYEDFYKEWDEFAALFGGDTVAYTDTPGDGGDGSDGGDGGDGMSPEELQEAQDNYVMPDLLADVLNDYGSFDENLDVNPASHVERDENNNYNAADKLSLDNVTHNRNRNRANLQSVCNLAKEPAMGMDSAGNSVQIRDDRVTVFTIAFLAPSNARDDMRQCASGSTTDGTKSNYFFDVRNLNVGSAFTAIARTINQLRLTN